MSTTILAQEALIGSDPTSLSVNMRLYNGSFHRVGNDLQTYQMGNFETYDILLDLKTSLSELKKKKRKYREMTFSELRRAKAASGKELQELNEIKIEYYKKFTIPCASFVFALMGIPLGIRKIRGGKSYGFIISLMVILVYYLLLLTAETLAKGNTLVPLLAMWIPNIVMGMLGVVLLRAAARESPPPLLPLLTRCIAQCRISLASIFRDR